VRHRRTTPGQPTTLRRRSPRRLRSRIPAWRRTFRGRRLDTATTPRRPTPGRRTRTEAARITAEPEPQAHLPHPIRRTHGRTDRLRPPIAHKEATAQRRRITLACTLRLSSTTLRLRLPIIPAETVLRTTPAVAEEAAVEEATLTRPVAATQATAGNERNTIGKVFRAAVFGRSFIWPGADTINQLASS